MEMESYGHLREEEVVQTGNFAEKILSRVSRP